MKFHNIKQDVAAVNLLLDEIIKMKNLKNDAALCLQLEVMPPVISKIRHGTIRLGATLVVRIHEYTGMPIAWVTERTYFKGGSK